MQQKRLAKLALLSFALCLPVLTLAQEHVIKKVIIGLWTAEVDRNGPYAFDYQLCSVILPDHDLVNANPGYNNRDRMEWSAYNDGGNSNRNQAIVSWTENGAVQYKAIWFKVFPEKPKEELLQKFLRVARGSSAPVVTDFRLEPTDWKTGPEIFKKRCMGAVNQLPLPIATRITDYYRRQ